MEFFRGIFEQSELITSLRAEVERLTIENANLKARIVVLEKNYGNSSKPLSSDIVKPSRDFSPSHQHHRRKISGQKGHTCHTRPQFSQDQVDDVIPLHFDRCPVCGGEVTLTDQESPRIHQQVEVVAKPFIVTEYHQYRYRYWCEHCQCYHYAELPNFVRNSGLFGAKLIALTTYLKSRGHMSYKTLQDWESEYFLFIQSGIKPTNNRTEQTIRQIVIDRKITQGTRSKNGNNAQERFWSILTTCKQQGKNFIKNFITFLQNSINAALNGLPPPILIKK
ncbi:MAG: hypothetical protein LBP87_03065 [Planctomycetaceae bacterium]|jgi:hypothetical protein|nr:hypothetical protein [Planctomycetaceae bacterium]